jgi:hypothetical protein
VDKKYYYYGGGGVAFILLILYIRKKKSASSTTDNTAVMTLPSAMSFSPISSGVNSTSGGESIPLPTSSLTSNAPQVGTPSVVSSVVSAIMGSQSPAQTVQISAPTPMGSVDQGIFTGQPNVTSTALIDPGYAYNGGVAPNDYFAGLQGTWNDPRGNGPDAYKLYGPGSAQWAKYHPSNSGGIAPAPALDTTPVPNVSHATPVDSASPVSPAGPINGIMPVMIQKPIWQPSETGGDGGDGGASAAAGDAASAGADGGGVSI